MHQRPIYRTFDTIVRRVEDVTPRMRRITLHGASLIDFESDRPGQWVKLFFDHTDTGRAFTIRHWLPKSRELVIDIVRHEHGIAGEWIAQAKPGMTVRVAGPRSDFRYEDGRQIFLFGDETALPAISAIVEDLPAAARAVVVIECVDHGVQLAVPSKATVNWSWINADPDQPSRHLSAYSRQLTLSPETSQIWVGCECSGASEMRAQFRELGFDKASLHASGYWKKGTVEHVDGDSDY